MDQKLLEKVLVLKEELDKNPEVVELNRLNNLLESSEEVMKLAYAKDMKVINYEDSIKHFGENSEEAKKAQKELYEAKLELDNNELVKKYNSQYKKVQDLYGKINEELFKPFY